MTDVGHPVIARWFDDQPRTASSHFHLCHYGTVLGVLNHAAVVYGSFSQAVEQFPFLTGYNNELATCVEGLDGPQAFTQWWSTLGIWERRIATHLPLRSLSDATGLDRTELCGLLTLGLVEEDSRFGALLEALQGLPGVRRPTLGFLRRCWQEVVSPDRIATLVASWRDCGLVQAGTGDGPRMDQSLQVAHSLWDALRGTPDAPTPEWARPVPVSGLPELGELVLPANVRAGLTAFPRLWKEGALRVVVLRGPHHNGRRTTLAAVARSLGRELLEFQGLDRPEDPRWREAGQLALLRHSFPVIALDPVPGEVARLPECWPDAVPLGVVVGPNVALTGSLAAEAMALPLPRPDYATRCEHWRRELAPDEAGLVPVAGERFRLTKGNLCTAARLAHSHAALAGRRRRELPDLVAATRSLNQRTLDALARRIPVRDDLGRLCASELTLQELCHLEQRCRHRERLPALLDGTPGGSPNAGVRSLFTGPSGTGKTLAARLLAGTLGKELYQLDLSAVVNKYIGETEKNLNRIFDLAEELDVILLLDEGDALLTRRTDVQSSNDRYANLETNFLLQRLESFDGIVIITTNARGRIDPAFERRMDIVVEFHVPDARERWQLWNLHLPPGRVIDDESLGEIATRCELTGGQIRNAVVHASLMALDNGGQVTGEILEAAVRREYLKHGALCPLMSAAARV